MSVTLSVYLFVFVIVEDVGDVRHRLEDDLIVQAAVQHHLLSRGSCRQGDPSTSSTFNSLPVRLLNSILASESGQFVLVDDVTNVK